MIYPLWWGGGSTHSEYLDGSGLSEVVCWACAQPRVNNGIARRQNMEAFMGNLSKAEGRQRLERGTANVPVPQLRGGKNCMDLAQLRTRRRVIV